MEVICDCGATMELNLFEPDQDEAFVGYDCSRCGASFYGTIKQGHLEELEE